MISLSEIPFQQEEEVETDGSNGRERQTLWNPTDST